MVAPKDGEHFIFPIADRTVKLSGRHQVFSKSTSIQDHPARGEEHNDDVQRESEGSQLLDTFSDDSAVRKDCWSIEENYNYRHHVEPRVKLYVPKEEEKFPIPLRKFYMTKRTILDVFLDSDRNLFEPWTGFARFTILNEKPPEGYTWTGRRLTKIQATTRPDYLWPDSWTGMSKAAQRREKQQLAFG